MIQTSLFECSMAAASAAVPVEKVGRTRAAILNVQGCGGGHARTILHQFSNWAAADEPDTRVSMTREGCLPVRVVYRRMVLLLYQFRSR